MKEKPKVPHINARAETVHKLPLFREAFAKRRCLTGFCTGGGIVNLESVLGCRPIGSSND
jgi:hypothetical protein